MDNDRDVAEIVQTILIDEGFKVSCLYEPSTAAVKAAIDKLEPDVVLLDGGGAAEFGPSWEIASWLVKRPRPIPTVMLTAHSLDRDEAAVGTSARALAAQFAGVVPKPFDIDRLITTVWNAIGQPVKQPISDAQEAANAALLVERLRAAGAVDLNTSKIGRVWVTFRAGSANSLYKVYRWRAMDVYFVGRYATDGTQMEALGEFTDLDALIAYCLALMTPQLDRRRAPLVVPQVDDQHTLA